MKVRVCSFSYKNSYPSDSSAHGGGFVFDCRALPNPGRELKFKELTGQDQSVRQYLEAEQVVEDFFQLTFKLVSLSIDNYLARNFEYLSVAYGCTGGQHRSVYCAERLAECLSKIEGVEFQLEHLQMNKIKPGVL